MLVLSGNKRSDRSGPTFGPPHHGQPERPIHFDCGLQLVRVFPKAFGAFPHKSVNGSNRVSCQSQEDTESRLNSWLEIRLSFYCK